MIIKNPLYLLCLLFFSSGIMILAFSIYEQNYYGFIGVGMAFIYAIVVYYLVKATDTKKVIDDD